jgi:hypothetical protein
VVQEETPTDDEGYLEPREFPLYVEFRGPDDQTTDGATGITRTKEQNEQQNSSNRGGAGNNVAPAAVSRPCDVEGSNIYARVNKQRRLPSPPSPPAKRNEASSSSTDDMDAQEHGVSKDKTYEDLKKDSNRDSVYEPLDRNIMPRK